MAATIVIAAIVGWICFWAGWTIALYMAGPVADQVEKREKNLGYKKRH